MNRSPSHVALLLLVSMLASFARAQDPNTLTAEEQQAGWRLLFDGQTTTGWRGYKSTTVVYSQMPFGRRNRFLPENILDAGYRSYNGLNEDFP